MNHSVKLMCVLAHPDDESLATGGVLAKYAAEGVETYLLTATRGERGWWGSDEDNPGLAELGRIREAELHAAARVLGLREVVMLDYVDGELDQADPIEAAQKIATELRRVRPDVVITFDPDGVYGHPDHIAISQLTLAAVMLAADTAYADHGRPPQRVSKLYYRTFTAAHLAAYQAAFGDLVMTIDGEERRATGWPEWAMTTRIDTRAYWPQVWAAVEKHRSQLPSYQKLKNLPPEHHQNLWGEQTYYRAFSLVNGGRTIETDLLAGLRATVAV